VDDGLDAALLTALRHLPDRQREVIALRVFLDLGIDTIAEHLGIAWQWHAQSPAPGPSGRRDPGPSGADLRP
jgi:DNA-directed RNA polymerase specialized sigma subunit